MARMNYAREVRQAHSAFNKRCEGVADAIRKELVIPFCRAHNLTFSVSMGTWCFWTHDGKCFDEGHIQQMSGTKRLLAALNLEVDHHNTLGTAFVQDVSEDDIDEAGQ
jgi:hypothetical protein